MNSYVGMAMVKKTMDKMIISTYFSHLPAYISATHLEDLCRMVM